MSEQEQVYYRPYLPGDFILTWNQVYIRVREQLDENGRLAAGVFTLANN